MPARKQLDSTQIAADHRSGMSQRALATKHGVSISAIRLRLAETGEPAHELGWNNRRNIDLELIANRYRDGESATAIGLSFGICAGPILKRLRSVGIAIRTNEANLIGAVHTPKKGPDCYQFKELPIEEIRTQYLLGDSVTRIGARYGVCHNTIVRRLKCLGIELRERGFPKKCTSKDGHIVSSPLEAEIDDWLFSHGLAHEIAPPVPWKRKGTAEYADFRVNGVYIEFWGVVGNKRYEKRRKRKQANYAACGASLIDLFPHHVLAGDWSPLETLL